MSVLVTVQIPFGDEPYVAIYEIRNTAGNLDGVCTYQVTRVGDDEVLAVVTTTRPTASPRLSPR